MRTLEPFAIVAALAVLSMGVIKAVEVGVPTRADYEDKRRVAEANAADAEKINAYAAALEGNFAPEFGDDDLLFQSELDTTLLDDPLLGPHALSGDGYNTLTSVAASAPQGDSKLRDAKTPTR